MSCPRCGDPGAWTYCWTCHRYVDDEAQRNAEIGAEAARLTESSSLHKDRRSEDERKRDALPAVESLGWTVFDTEQGFRPFQCRHCGGDIAGGSRVPKGFPDWVVVGHGLVVFVEWKTDTNQLSESQEVFQSVCDESNVPHFVARDTRGVVSWLQSLKREVR